MAKSETSRLSRYDVHWNDHLVGYFDELECGFPRILGVWSPANEPQTELFLEAVAGSVATIFVSHPDEMPDDVFHELFDPLPTVAVSFKKGAPAKLDILNFELKEYGFANGKVTARWALTLTPKG